MRQFNTRLARIITRGVATMWCAYVFTIIALISLPAAVATHSLIVIVAWVAQTFLQLVLLSVIMVGQKDTSNKVDQNHQAVVDLHNSHHRELLQHIAKLQ